MKTWHYIVIAGGVLVVAYLALSPKSTLLKGTKPASSTSLGGTLTGGGALATGLSDLSDSIRGWFDDEDSSDESAE
jgi:hypothetical protein